MESNLELYNKWKSVPQNALKKFDNGKFKGDDINTMWRIKCLTDQFGPCGVGWYFTIKRTWVEETPIKEQFAFAEIELFIKVDGQWSMPISGNGGNKLTRVLKSGEFSTSDEAFKMAVTDAFGVACRSLGIGADVYWENDKTKYTESQRDAEEDKKLISKEVREEAAALDIALENVALYLKKEVSDLTEDDVKNAINIKRQAYAQKGIRK